MPDCSKSLLGGGQGLEDMSFLPSSQGMNNNSLHFSPEVVKALIGEPLTEEDLLKVCCKGARIMCSTDSMPCFSNNLPADPHVEQASANCQPRCE